MPGWTEVLPDVLLWRDSCNVYAVLGEDAALIVDAGTGEWLDGIGALPVPPRALALTHYLRDHSAGAAQAARAGIPIHVPEGEHEILRDPAEHFRRRETYLIYDNVWDLCAPIEPIPVAGLLRDYEQTTLAGIDVRVIPLPGATPTQIGLQLRTPRSDRLVAFSAETIHSPGRLPRIAPLQYDLSDLLGAVNVAFSAHQLEQLKPELLLPSLGDPIADAPAGALTQLRENLLAHTCDRDAEQRALRLVGRDAVERITDGVWRSTQGRAASHFVIGRSGRCLVLDYGYWHATGAGEVEPGVDPFLLPADSLPERRRPLLHSLDALREATGVEQLDAVIPTHYHDDHVCGIPLLQRLHGISCWAPATFARLLAEPSGHAFTATWPGAIRIGRELPLDEPLEWDGIRFELEPMSGHTRFSALIGWEVDGVRYVHAGDQYVPTNDRLPPRDWPAPGLLPNHFYRNGSALDGYRHSAEWIAAFRPDVVLGGHWLPVRTDDRYFELLAEYGRAFEARHRRVMALDDDAPHFGMDGMAGWIWPYRTHVPDARPIAYEVTVRNPLPTEAALELRLVGPPGWEGSRATVTAAGRAEVTTAMTIVPAVTPCRRQPIALELRAGGRPFGQVLEALVTVGGDTF